MDKQSRKTLAILALIIVLAAICTYIFLNKNSTEEIIETDFERTLSLASEENKITSFAGQEISIDDYKNKPLVVVSWASWCPSCVQTLNQLSVLGTEYESREVSIIAINRAEKPELAKQFLRSLNIDTTGLVTALDSSDSFFENVDGKTMPEVILYNSAGEIVSHQKGNFNIQLLELELGQLLEHS